VLPGRTRERYLRSKFVRFALFCNSRRLSHFAAFVFDGGPEVSIVVGHVGSNTTFSSLQTCRQRGDRLPSHGPQSFLVEDRRPVRGGPRSRQCGRRLPPTVGRRGGLRPSVLDGASTRGYGSPSPCPERRDPERICAVLADRRRFPRPRHPREEGTADARRGVPSGLVVLTRRPTQPVETGRECHESRRGHPIRQSPITCRNRYAARSRREVVRWRKPRPASRSGPPRR
jgi:hypothetical protein